MLLFYSLELIFSIISCAVFLLKTTECKFVIKRALIYIFAFFFPLYIVLVYFDYLLLLSLFAPYSLLLFAVDGISKKTGAFMVAFFQAISFAVTSTIILVENFFVTDNFCKSIIDNAVEFCILLTMLFIKKTYLQSKLNSFMKFIPTSLKVFIVISLYIIALLACGLSYISKTEFINQSWYYFLEILFILSLITFCVLYPILISSVTSKNYYKKISEVANEQSKRQYNYYQKLMEKEQSLKEFRHNYKNQLIVLKAYLEKGDLLSAQNYLSDSSDYIDEISNIQTGNYILDVLLSDKKQSANGINIKVKGYLSASFVEPIDICTIFGNALDNAIEACQTVNSNRTINIILEENINTIHIRITNPVSQNIKIINNHIPTTKIDKSNHGIGLYSIRRIVEKYNGKINIECNNNIFSLNMLLVDIGI